MHCSKPDLETPSHDRGFGARTRTMARLDQRSKPFAPYTGVERGEDAVTMSSPAICCLVSASRPRTAKHFCGSADGELPLKMKINI